jgi:hypothetical protein
LLWRLRLMRTSVMSLLLLRGGELQEEGRFPLSTLMRVCKVQLPLGPFLF